MEKFEFAARTERHASQHETVYTISFLRDAWRRLKRNKVVIVCLVIFLSIALASFLAPLLAPHDPTVQNLQYANLPPKILNWQIPGFNGMKLVKGVWVDVYQARDVAPNTYFIFGTDEFGRDLFSRTLYGVRISLIIAFVAAILDLSLGVLYGVFSGLKGGKTDSVMQRILELLSGIPTLVIVIIMMMFLPSGIISIVTALVISSWFPMARLVRAETMRIRNMEYVSAARVLGATDLQIAVHHVLPNIAGIIVVRMMFSVPASIFLEAFLSFIGIGMKPPAASLGVLLNNGYKVFRIYPYQMWIPTVIMCLIMLSLNFLADGLRDIFDPKMKDY